MNIPKSNRKNIYRLTFVGIVSTSILWAVYVLFTDYQDWLSGAVRNTNMQTTIRNGILLITGLGILLGGLAIFLVKPSDNADIQKKNSSSNEDFLATEPASPEAKMLSLSGAQYVLEVRGLGSFVGNHGNTEIWMMFDLINNAHQSILSNKPEDYPWDINSKFGDFSIANAVAFRDAAKHALERWPIPVLSWGPPKHPLSDSRAADNISAVRQGASLGIHLLLWEEDADTDDGVSLIQRLFAFFDKNPDAPGVIVLSADGDIAREAQGEPGRQLLKNGYYAPDMPDSVVAMWVTRTDRVDKFIRPFVVKQPEGINKTHTQYDIIKLWNYYWKKNDAPDDDSFGAYYKRTYQGPRSALFAPPFTMSSAWWHQQLPTLWQQITNTGPGDFKPSPYLPIRWTDWQLKQFDAAPVVGYLHRPIDIKLTDEHGKPLDRLARRTLLQKGWQQALATLPEGERPKRIFYDTTLGNSKWAGQLNQALQQIDPDAPDLLDDDEGYNLGVRIGNMGVSAPGMQLALGIIAGYHFGGPSATVHLRPNGDAMMMVSPMGKASKEAYVAVHGKNDPFGSPYPPDMPPASAP